MTPICPEHNLEALVKSNIRNKKTGRLYPPFFGCPWTGEDEYGKRIYCNHRFTEKPSTGQLVTSAKEGSLDKDKAIKYMNALKIASELIAAGHIRADENNPLIEWWDTLKEAAEIVYRMQPPEG